MFKYAITRKPSKNFANGITKADLGKPDYDLMLKQHVAYMNLLKTLGLEVFALDALENFPDAHFVEDAAVITPKIAILTNPGAESRKGEQDKIEPELTKYRKIERVNPPGTVDGGDVLMVGDWFFIGISERTNREGARQLGQNLKKYGYGWKTVLVEAGLHLKSGVNYVGKNTLLLTKEYSNRKEFDEFDKILVGENETYAANTLFINNNLIMPAGFPNTKKRLEQLEFPIIELDMSEARKMDGGLTCLSLRF